MRDVRLGSQLYINKTDTPEQVSAWVRQMHEAGLRVIRLFMVWDQLEPREGEWDFSNYDACFETAVQCGMTVVPTLMSVSPPGWMRVTGGTQDIGNIDDAAFRERTMEYVRKIVSHYHTCPALDSWILWNEPSREFELNDYNMDDWIEFLKREYNNDIAQLNKHHFKQYDSFEQIKEKQEGVACALGFKGYAEAIDWANYVVYSLCENLRLIAAEIRKIDTVHELHVNPHDVATPNYFKGQSVFEEAKIVDFVGCSAHPSWHSVRFAPDRIDQSVAYYADLMKSTTRHKEDKFWVSELQGGTNIFSGNTYLCPSYDDITHWLWESLGSGAEAAVFWCFNARSDGFEGGEWGLLNQLGQPSERLEAASAVAQTVQENQALFNSVKAPKPDVYILYSDNSILLGATEGNGNDPLYPRNVHIGMDALIGTYLMCADLDLSAKFIHESEVNRLHKGDTLLLPNTYALEADVVESIDMFVKNGGTVIADGMCAMKDRYGVMAHESLKKISNVFGAQVEDIKAIEAPVLSLSDCEVKGWFLSLELFPSTAEIIGVFDNGKCAVTKNSYYDGTAYRIGTMFFQRYFTRQSQASRKLLCEMLNIQKEIGLLNPTHLLRLKVLEGDGKRLLILKNRDGAQHALVKIPQEYNIRCINQECTCIRNGDICDIQIDAQDVLVFEATL